MRRIVVAITLALAIGIAAWVNRGSVAVLLAPTKKATSARTESALKADERFWQAFTAAPTMRSRACWRS